MEPLISKLPIRDDSWKEGNNESKRLQYLLLIDNQLDKIERISENPSIVKELICEINELKEMKVPKALQFLLCTSLELCLELLILVLKLHLKVLIKDKSEYDDLVDPNLNHKELVISLNVLNTEAVDLYEIFIYFKGKHTYSNQNFKFTEKYMKMSRYGIYLLSLYNHQDLFDHIEKSFESKILTLPINEREVYIQSLADLRLDFRGVIKFFTMFINIINNTSPVEKSNNTFKYHDLLLVSHKVILHFIHNFPAIFSEYYHNRSLDFISPDVMKEMSNSSLHFFEASSANSTFDSNFKFETMIIKVVGIIEQWDQALQIAPQYQQTYFFYLLASPSTIRRLGNINSNQEISQFRKSTYQRVRNCNEYSKGKIEIIHGVITNFTSLLLVFHALSDAILIARHLSQETKQLCNLGNFISDAETASIFRNVTLYVGRSVESVYLPLDDVLEFDLYMENPKYYKYLTSQDGKRFCWNYHNYISVTIPANNQMGSVSIYSIMLLMLYINSSLNAWKVTKYTILHLYAIKEFLRDTKFEYFRNSINQIISPKDIREIIKKSIPGISRYLVRMKFLELNAITPSKIKTPTSTLESMKYSVANELGNIKMIQHLMNIIEQYPSMLVHTYQFSTKLKAYSTSPIFVMNTFCHSVLSVYPHIGINTLNALKSIYSFTSLRAMVDAVFNENDSNVSAASTVVNDSNATPPALNNDIQAASIVRNESGTPLSPRGIILSKERSLNGSFVLQNSLPPSPRSTPPPKSNSDDKLHDRTISSESQKEQIEQNRGEIGSPSLHVQNNNSPSLLLQHDHGNEGDEESNSQFYSMKKWTLRRPSKTPISPQLQQLIMMERELINHPLDLIELLYSSFIAMLPFIYLHYVPTLKKQYSITQLPSSPPLTSSSPISPPILQSSSTATSAAVAINDQSEKDLPFSQMNEHQFSNAMIEFLANYIAARHFFYYTDYTHHPHLKFEQIENKLQSQFHPHARIHLPLEESFLSVVHSKAERSPSFELPETLKLLKAIEHFLFLIICQIEDLQSTIISEVMKIIKYYAIEAIAIFQCNPIMPYIELPTSLSYLATHLKEGEASFIYDNLILYLDMYNLYFDFISSRYRIHRSPVINSHFPNSTTNNNNTSNKTTPPIDTNMNTDTNSDTNNVDDGHGNDQKNNNNNSNDNNNSGDDNKDNNNNDKKETENGGSNQSCNLEAKSQNINIDLSAEEKRTLYLKLCTKLEHITNTPATFEMWKGLFDNVRSYTCLVVSILDTELKATQQQSRKSFFFQISKSLSGSGGGNRQTVNIDHWLKTLSYLLTTSPSMIEAAEVTLLDDKITNHLKQSLKSSSTPKRSKILTRSTSSVINESQPRHAATSKFSQTNYSNLNEVSPSNCINYFYYFMMELLVHKNPLLSKLVAQVIGTSLPLSTFPLFISFLHFHFLKIKPETATLMLVEKIFFLSKRLLISKLENRDSTLLPAFSDELSVFEPNFREIFSTFFFDITMFIDNLEGSSFTMLAIPFCNFLLYLLNHTPITIQSISLPLSKQIIEIILHWSFFYQKREETVQSSPVIGSKGKNTQELNIDLEQQIVSVTNSFLDFCKSNQITSNDKVLDLLVADIENKIVAHKLLAAENNAKTLFE